MKLRFWTLALMLGLVAAAHGATNDLTGLLQKGLFEEEANRDLPAAIANYQSLANSFDKDRQLAATAIFRLGECYRKLGKTNEAIVQYQRILKEFSDQQTLVTLSRQNLSGLHADSGATSNPQSLDDLHLAVIKAQRLVRSVDSTIEAAHGTNRGPVLIYMFRDDNKLQLLMDDQQALRQRLIELSKSYTPENPLVKDVQAQIEAKQKAMEERADELAAAAHRSLDLAQEAYNQKAAELGPAGSTSNANLAVAGRDSAGDLQRQYALLKAQLELAKKETNNQIVAELFSDNKELADRLRVELAMIPSYEAILSEAKARGSASAAEAERNFTNLLAQVNDARQQIFSFQEIRLRALAAAIEETRSARTANTAIEGEPLVATGEEQQEIRRIQFMIQNSPDLINAPGWNADLNQTYTPLICAAAEGQLAVAKYLLDHGADVDGRASNQGSVPLLAAAESGHKAMVELLLARGADVNGKGLNPLYEAVAHGFTGVAEVLIASNANVNLRAGTVTGGRRSLHAAVRSGKTELIQLLIAHGADVNAADDQGRTALHWTVDFAGMQDELPAAKMLLAAKASVDPRDSQGHTPLYDAAGKGNADMVSLLLDSGASVDATNNIRGTPLQIAVYNRHIAAAKVLLEHKADPNHLGAIIDPLNNSWVNAQPVYFAIGATNNPMLKLLLDSGASPNPTSPGSSQSQLFYAIDRNEVEAVGLLLDHGADPNLSEHGIPALNLVLRTGKNTRMIPLLLDKGADPNARDSEGMPALFLTQNPEIATWLIEHKADVNGRLKDGATPVMRGLWTTNYIKVLLQKGANVDLQETNGNTALHLAVYYGNPPATAVLLEGKANPNIQNSQGYTPLDLAEGGKKGANLYAMLNPGPGSGSSPARDMEEQIAQLLINAGGLANLPKRDRIEVRRASYSPFAIYKDPQGRNQMSLLEVIACKYSLLSPAFSGEWQIKDDSKRSIFRSGFPFPDFKNVVIYRRTENSTRQTAIKADVEDILNSGDCSRDVQLQWGDVIEIPESDHPVDEQWDGLSETIANPLIKCVSRQVTLKIKGESTALKLAPQLAATSSLGAYGLRQWHLTTPSFMLRSVLDNSKLIRVSSDLAHVKVTRADPATGKATEWTIDCTESNQSGLWLRDGDVIEVPEK